jgi:hypothetical protein
MKKILFATFLSALSFSAHAAKNAVVQFDAPTQYEDGSALDATTEITGYTLYYGKQSGVYDKTIAVGANEREVTVSNLSGTYYFAMTSTTTELEESLPSNEISAKFSKGKAKKFIIRFRPN